MVFPKGKMPAEWKTHQATWLSWPKNLLTFPKSILPKVESIYSKLISVLQESEKVMLLVDDQKQEELVKSILAKNKVDIFNLSFVKIKSADVWIRDYNPIFLLDGDKKEGVKWRFNAWGNKYEDLLLDDQTGKKILEFTKVPGFFADIVLEGGSIDVNGKGILLTTRQCLLNKNRNPNLNQKQIEFYLEKYLGIEKIIWLNQGVEGDDTDGHIDNIARFIDEKSILCAYEEKVTENNHHKLKENFEYLKNCEEDFEIIKLPMPEKVIFEKKPLPASYANFYISNKAVLVPVFNCQKDREAIKILEECFPKKEIVPIQAKELVIGYGAIHCITSQEPKGII